MEGVWSGRGEGVGKWWEEGAGKGGEGSVGGGRVRWGVGGGGGREGCCERCEVSGEGVEWGDVGEW